MLNATLTIKRGDTLALDCQLLDGATPVDMTGWQIDCWVRDGAARVVHRFAAAITDAAQGRYLLPAASAVTRAWPVGRLDTDIRYQDGAGTVMHTCTLQLHVADTVTVP